MPNPIGYFHIDIAEVRTEQGKLHLFVAIDRTSKFAFAQLHERATTRIAAEFLRALLQAVPYRVHTVPTDNGQHFTTPGNITSAAQIIREAVDRGEIVRAHSFELACAQNRIEQRLTKPYHPVDKRPGRENEQDAQGGHRPALPLRQARRAPQPSRPVPRCLQLRPAAQDPERSHALRVHLPLMGHRAS
jgi:hypothetical protein